MRKKNTITINKEILKIIIQEAMSTQHSKELGNPNYKGIDSEILTERIWEDLGGE